MTTAADVAAFMISLLERDKELRQDDAAIEISIQFGEPFVCYNNGGNLAISADVLKAFNQVTPNVVWLRSSRYWRLRQAGDNAGRMQPY